VQLKGKEKKVSNTLWWIVRDLDLL
jgi:hypothetical protein